MEDQGGLYSPDRYRSKPVPLGLPKTSQPTPVNGSNDDELSPGRISVATVETWPRFSDNNDQTDTYPHFAPATNASSGSVLPMYNSLSAAEPTARTPREVGERVQSGTMNLLAMADIRIRSRYPIQILCPHCSMDVVTMVVPKRGATVYCGCILMTFVGLCCVPFLLPAMQDIQHFCPHCSQLVGTSAAL